MDRSRTHLWLRFRGLHARPVGWTVRPAHHIPGWFGLLATSSDPTVAFRGLYNCVQEEPPEIVGDCGNWIDRLLLVLDRFRLLHRIIALGRTTACCVRLTSSPSAKAYR